MRLRRPVSAVMFRSWPTSRGVRLGAVAGKGKIDEGGVESRKALIAKAPAFHGPWPEGFDQDIGLAGEPAEDRRSRRAPQVQGDGLGSRQKEGKARAGS